MEKVERKAYQNTIQQTSSEKLMQGDEANKFLDYLLSETNGIPVYQTDNPLNRCSGYFDDGKKWIAFYNLSGSCWLKNSIQKMKQKIIWMIPKVIEEKHSKI